MFCNPLEFQIMSGPVLNPGMCHLDANRTLAILAYFT